MTPDLNSALYWFPRIQAAGLPVPKTILVPYNHPAVMYAMESGEGSQQPPIGLAPVAEAAAQIGLPVFIRGDHCSTKHQGPRSYKWEGVDQNGLARILCGIVEDTEMKLWMQCDLTESAFMVREFLDLEATFEAFGHMLGDEGRIGHPIAREWRFFAKSTGEVVCAHPYWDPDAFDAKHAPWGYEIIGEHVNEANDIKPSDGPAGWQDGLAMLEAPLPADEYQALCTMASEAAKACPEGVAWSVDFARDRDGKWWLIDMALAKDSHHRPGCENISRLRQQLTPMDIETGVGNA